MRHPGLAPLLAVSMAGSMALARPPWPDVMVESNSRFEGSSSTSGVLRSPYCFTAPRVCAPAGSWVWYTGSFCGPRSGADCDNREALPRLQAVDASAPLTVEGLVFAPNAHRRLKPDEDEGDRRYSLRIEAGQRLVGLLHKAAVVDGVALAPGPVTFTYFTEASGPTLGRVLEGVTAEAMDLEGFRVPAGTAFRRESGLSLSLTKRAARGAVFTSLREDAFSASDLLQYTATAGVETFDVERLRLVSPLAFHGLTFTGEVTRARRRGRPEWESMSGEVLKPSTDSSYRVPAKSVVTWCADGTLERAEAPAGALLTFQGLETPELRARREPVVPPQAVPLPFPRCDAGTIVGYDAAVRRCPEGDRWTRAFVRLTLEGKAAEPAGQPFLATWLTGPCKAK